MTPPTRAASAATLGEADPLLASSSSRRHPNRRRPSRGSIDRSAEAEEKDVDDANPDARRPPVVAVVALAALLAAVAVSSAAVVRSRAVVSTDATAGRTVADTFEASAAVVVPVAAASTATAKKTTKTKSPPFPDDFVWGASTSAFQIEGGHDEGGRGPSIWDVWCHEDPTNCDNDNGDVADDHYHRWRSDVDLMRELGLKAYRFSISWSRILPHGKGTINPEGIAFYDDLINALIDVDIEPWVTLYHWDLPQSLQEEYIGWLSRDIVDDFGNYARICFESFGDRVKRWITINEPWTVAVHGYAEGSNAPGRKSDDEPYLVAHHLILSHARAVRIYRTEMDDVSKNDGAIGIALCGDFRYPLDPSDRADVDAAIRAMEFQFGWFADPICFGSYPSSMRDRLGDRLPSFSEHELREVLGSVDFWGLNHYSSLIASQPKETPTYSGYWADMSVDFADDPKWRKTSMGWNVVPKGCRDMLRWIDKRYGRPIVYVTENGTADDDDVDDVGSAEEDSPPLRDDASRRDFLEGYVRECKRSIEDDGVRLGGYFAWSLMDNFEWQYGYSKRFGIVRVDYDTLRRHPKASAIWYRDTIASNGENLF